MEKSVVGSGQDMAHCEENFVWRLDGSDLLDFFWLSHSLLTLFRRHNLTEANMESTDSFEQKVEDVLQGLL